MRLYGFLFVCFLVIASPALAKGGVYQHPKEYMRIGEGSLEGYFVQGGYVIGKTRPNARVRVNQQEANVTPDGTFAFGFGRDAAETAILTIQLPGIEKVEKHSLKVAKRDYDIQRITGVAKKYVSPPPNVLARIKEDNRAIGKARRKTLQHGTFLTPFIWPAQGRISGVYGSQRFFNGVAKRPHFGIDIAAPKGRPVVAPAGGTVTLVRDMYYSGLTMALDHGYGISSTFLHLDTAAVKAGDRVEQGQRIGTVGASGRVTGPHLDWRLNWYKVRLDPGLLVQHQPLDP